MDLFGSITGFLYDRDVKWLRMSALELNCPHLTPVFMT